ncbi:CotO family spore coat protein [Metabacillus sp. RGM 3146]|uniref:CotO family spore coat protein n=1 Tax=Metabacillus sp. RGM 3146 TaxID=3401092 RepID=UPI003B9CF80E
MIKSTKGYEGKPLMYIVQPENVQVKAEMQTLVIKKSAKYKAAEKTPEIKAAAERELESKPSEAAEKLPEAAAEAETPIVTEAAYQITESAEPVKKGIEQAYNKADGVLKAELVEEALEEQEQMVERRPRKPVSQMNIAEKVEFVTNLPVNIPRTLCHVEFSDGARRGIILSEEDGIVTIQATTSSQPIKVRMEEIKAIHLLGF